MASGISILNFCLIETTHHVLCVSLYIPAGIIFAQPFAWGDQLDAQILLRLKLLLRAGVLGSDRTLSSDRHTSFLL